MKLIDNGTIKKMYTGLFGKPRGKRPLGRCSRWEQDRSYSIGEPVAVLVRTITVAAQSETQWHISSFSKNVEFLDRLSIIAFI
jgi:hypothetical protein